MLSSHEMGWNGREREEGMVMINGCLARMVDFVNVFFSLRFWVRCGFFFPPFCLDEGMTLMKRSVMMLCRLAAMNDWCFLG